MAEKTTFIQLDRNIMNWQYYQDANTFRVFIHLLLSANVRPGYFNGERIERGQLATSYENMSKLLKLSYKQVRDSINKLKKTKSVAITRKSKYIVISILCYNKYQGFYSKKGNHEVNHGAITGNITGQSRGNNQIIYNNINNINKRARACENLSGGALPCGAPAEREREIPKEFLGMFSSYEEYWKWRNQ